MRYLIGFPLCFIGGCLIYLCTVLVGLPYIIVVIWQDFNRTLDAREEKFSWDDYEGPDQNN